MNKFYKRFLILIVLVLVISGTVIYTTVDINTLKTDSVQDVVDCAGYLCRVTRALL